MDLASVPGLTGALQARGYRVRGPAGLGASGTAWAADASDGQRAVVAVLDLSQETVVARRTALERLAALQALRHPHLVDLIEVVAIDAHRTALVTATVDGPTVGTVLELRPSWRPAEVVTLVVPLAEAVSALRAAGLRHGDIGPENVMLGPGGRPVLVDLASVALTQTGTPGFAAPRGADDVYSLGRLGLAALGAVDDDLATAGVRAALEAACSTGSDPLELARACFDATAPMPIEIPDAAVLTRAALTRFTEHHPVLRTVRDPRVARRRRALAAAGSVAAAATLVVSLGSLGGTDPGLGTGPEEGALVTSPTMDSGTGEVSEVSALVAAAVELTHRRAELLSEGAPERLEDVAVRGSEPFEADRALLASLEERGEELEVRAEDVEARWVGSRDGHELVLVTSRVHVEGRGSDAPARSVVLALARTPAGWRVAEVLDAEVEAGLNGPVGPLAG